MQKSYSTSYSSLYLCHHPLPVIIHMVDIFGPASTMRRVEQIHAGEQGRAQTTCH